MGRVSGTPLLSDGESSTRRSEDEVKPTRSVLAALRSWGVAYHGLNVPQDLLGGSLLALIVVMQGVAAAAIAHVCLVAGPYAGIAPPLVYGIFGTSRHLSVGSGAIIALVVAEQVEGMGDEDARTRAAVALTFLSGVLMFSMGACGLAFLIRFVSRPALSGLISGCGIRIITSQLTLLLGLNVPKASTPMGTWLQIGLNLHHARPATFSLSLALVVLLEGLKALKDRKGTLGVLSSLKELIAAAAGTLLCLLAQQQGWQWQIGLTGDVPAGLPQPRWPLAGLGTDEIHRLMPGAVAIVVTTFVSSFAGAKAVGLQQGYKIDAGRELLGLGFSSVLGSFFGAMPLIGSLNRTALSASIVRSQLGAGIAVAAVSAAAMASFAPLLGLVPKCALSALIVTSSYPLVDLRKPAELRRLQAGSGLRQSGDLLTWSAAFLATLCFGVVGGMCSGMLCAIAALIYQTMQPVMHVLGRTSSGQWIRLRNEHQNAEQAPGVLVVRVDGPLFFANAEYFEEQLYSFLEAELAAERSVHRVLLEASKVAFLDATSVEVLRGMGKNLLGRGIGFAIVEAPILSHQVLQLCLPELHPGACRGYRFTINEALEGNLALDDSHVHIGSPTCLRSA